MDKMQQPLEYDKLYDYADLCAKEGRHEEALAVYKELRRLKPDNDSLLLSIAWVYIDMGEKERALEYLEQLLEKELSRNIFTGFAFDEMVKMYRDIKEYDKLIMLCERAVDVYPHDPTLLATLGESCLKSGNCKRAFEVFSMLTDIDPDMSLYFMNRGIAAVEMGDYEKAEESVSLAIQKEPEDGAMIYDHLAGAYEKAGQHERAIQARMQAIERDRDNPYYHCGLGDLYLKLGRLDDAREAYEEACRISPVSRGTFRNRLAIMMIKAGFIVEAAEEFEKAIEIDPANPFYYLGLIGCLEAMGDEKGARKFKELGRRRGVLPWG